MLLHIIEQLSVTELSWLVLGALLIGVEKAGIKGLSMAVVSIYAIVLGGKASSGLLLLLFIMADSMAMRHYFRYAQRAVLKVMIPPALIGVVIGAVLGRYIEDAVFQDIIALIILSCLLLMLLPNFSANSEQAAQRSGTAVTIGLLTGFSTMIANVSSPILAIFLLALRLSKKEFIGTVVWFFFVINLIKLPFHIWTWETIRGETLITALGAVPILIAGFLLGLQLVNRIPERSFRYLIIGVTLVAALKLLLS